MSSPILARIAAQTGIPRLFTALAEELSPSDLQSLLLEVYRARAAAAREPELLARAGRGGLTAPSPIDARLLGEFDRAAFECASGYEALELSPVCPLGLTHALGRIDQNNVLSAIRSVEVLGDSTPALALECARRRRRNPAPVRLCASHRMIRLQRFDFPGYSPHFRLFSLVAAGRDTGSEAFDIRHLGEHLRFYLKLFRLLNSRGFRLAAPVVEITDLAIVESLLAAAGVPREQVRASIRAHDVGGSERFLAGRGITLPADVQDPASELPGANAHRLARVKSGLFDSLQSEFPEAGFRFNLARLEGLGYYTGLCLRVSPQAPDGRRYPVTDGGFTDWTARLLQNRKERMLSSGIGSEFICRQYR